MSKTKPNQRLAKAASLVPMGWPPANLLAQKREFAPKVVFDLHGPILDWTTRFCEFASEMFGRKLDAQKMAFYRMAYDTGMDITPVEFEQAFWAFARLSRGGYDALPAQPHSVEAFHAIRKAGIDAEIWTYCPGATDAPESQVSLGVGASQEGTYRLLENIGIGNAREVRRLVRFVHPEQKASAMASEHVPLIIEDHPGTAVTNSMIFGSATILVPESFNQHLTCPGVLRLEKREDLAEAVISFFDALEAAQCLNLSRKGFK